MNSETESATQAARREAFEAALLDHWADDQAWSVYADWLLAQGDPWGQRISLDLARGSGSAAERSRVERELAALARRESLLGAKLAARIEGVRERVGLTWSRGFVVAASLNGGAGDDADLLADLDALLDSPAGRFIRLVQVVVADPSPPERLRVVVERLRSRGAQPALHELHLVDTGARKPSTSPRSADQRIDDLGPLLALLPQLRRLELRGSGVGFGRGFVHERLEYLRVGTEGLPLAALAGLPACRLPELRRLLVIHDPSGPARDASLLLELIESAATMLPKLRHVAFYTPYTNELAIALSESALLAQLRTIDLGGASLEEPGGNAIADRVARFSQLELLSAIMSSRASFRSTLESALPGVASFMFRG